MSTFIWFPTYSGTSADIGFKVRTASFGDGYQQRVGDGINTLKRVWNMTFELPKPQTDAIEAFLYTLEGVGSFDWTPPTGPPGKWICPSWKPAAVGYNSYSIALTFTEVFGE